MPSPWPLLALALAADPRARLQALEARQAAEEAAARALLEREGSLLSAVDEAEHGWARAAAALRGTEADRAALAARLARAREGEAAAQVVMAGLQGQLGPRLRARARLGALSRLRLLLASGSLAELAKRSWLWSRLVSHDLGLLAQARRALLEEREARAAVERDAAALEAAAREAGRQRDEASARRAEHRALLGAIRGARSLHERAAAEAADQQGKLAAFVAALPPTAGAPPHTGFRELQGRLPLPVSGTVAVGFGPVVNPRFNTVTVQKGIDIRAPAGAEVQAVAAGRVAHAGWFKGYGNLVIVDHGDGYHTLVAHLGSMSTAMGEEVAAGAALGTVGDAGSPLGTYLYFEIREKGRPVDPRAWLRP